ncbi:MAG TPA: sulfatase-like hydrolase/transferase [Candidatus Limnocylindrales bacterium]
MSRPNVVLIFMDDWTHWALESAQVQTPNLDRLVRRGTTYTQARNQGSWTGAVCVAARAMLLSGRSLFHAREAVEDDSTVPLLGQAFGAAGYDTYFTGKWHNPVAALRRSYGRVGPFGGAMLVPAKMSDGSEDIGRPAPGNTWSPTDPAGEGHWMRVGGRVVHSSEHWIDNALGFLESHETGSPFFLHVALHAPHDPRQAPQRWLDRYPAGSIALPPNLLPSHPFDHGDYHIRDELLAPFPRTQEAVRLHRREYFAIASHADEQIGRLLDAVDSAGLADNTVVVFSGDHGLALGEHGLMGKQSMYEHSMRVPLVFAGPGVPAGVRDESLVYQASIFATLCALTGVPVPGGVEFPALLGRDSLVDAAFGGYRHLQRMIRTPRWALTAYATARRVQLFDVEADPWQVDDLAGDPGHRELVHGLLDRLRAMQTELGDDCGGWTSEIDDGWLVEAVGVS